MKNYICNLVIPGAAKSGTSSLHDLLDQHPHIKMSRPKEPQHFSFDSLYEGGAEAHNTLFSSDAVCRYYGESSQCYMIHPVAIARIKELLVAPKVILVLREPVDRLWSQYQWNYRRAVERAPLMQAITERGNDTGYNFNPAIRMYQENGAYLSLSRYTHWVPMWRETFGENNVLVLRTEDLQADATRVMKACFAFLDVAPFDIEERPRRNETSRMNRLPPTSIARLERSMPGVIRWSRLYQAPRWRLLRAFTPLPPPAMSPEEKDYVQNCLRDDIAFHESLAT